MSIGGPIYTTNDDEFDFERYSPYIEIIRALFVPSLENRIYSGLEEFVYNEDSQLAEWFPCVKKCIDLAASWKEPLDALCLKYKDVNVKAEVIKHLIKRLIRDGLIGCFVDSIVLNNRLNKISRDLDSLGIQKEWLGYLNVCNFINEKDYWINCDCSVSSSPTLYSTTSLQIASDRFTVGSDLQLENSSGFLKGPDESRNVRKRSASYECSEDIKVDHQLEASENSFEPSQDLLSSLKNGSNMFDQLYHEERSISTTTKTQNVSMRYRYFTYKIKHPKTNWKNERLKLHVSTVHSAETIEISRLIRTSCLSLPCKSQDLIYRISRVEALPILSRVSSNRIRKKFEIKMYNIASCLNNIFCRMDGRAVRKLCLFCEIRHNYLNFKLKPCDLRKAKVTLFTARVVTGKNLRKDISAVQRESIDNTMQERREEQKSAENVKYDDNESASSDCSLCGGERKTVSSSSASSSSTSRSSGKAVETLKMDCGCECSYQFENLSPASSIDKVIEKLKMSSFKGHEQDHKLKSKIQEVLNLLSTEEKGNFIEVERNVQSTSTQTLEPEKYSRGINIDLLPTESVVSLKSNVIKTSSFTELNTVKPTSSSSDRSHEKFIQPDESSEQKMRESLDSSKSWSRFRESVESEKVKEGVTYIEEGSAMGLKTEPSSLRNSYDAPASLDEEFAMGLKMEPLSLRNSHNSFVSLEKGFAMDLKMEPSSLRNSYDAPASLDEEFAMGLKMEPSSLRNSHNSFVSIEEGFAMDLKMEPSSLRNSYDAPASLNEESTMCSKMESSNIRESYDEDIPVESHRTRGSSSASTKSVRFVPCRSICCSKSHHEVPFKSECRRSSRNNNKVDADPHTRDNYTTMRSPMNSRSFCETLSSCSIDRLKHLIKAKLRRRFLRTKSVRSTSASTSKTFLSNNKYYLSVSSCKASRQPSRNQSHGSASNSIDSICVNSLNNNSQNSSTLCSNRTCEKKSGNIYYSDVEDYSLRKFKESDILVSEGHSENQNSVSSTFDHGDLQDYDQKSRETVRRVDQDQTYKIHGCPCGCDCSLKKKRTKSFSQRFESSKEFLMFPSHALRSFSDQNREYGGPSADENQCLDTINSEDFYVRNQSKGSLQGQSMEYTFFECCSDDTILHYPVTVFLCRDRNKENSVGPVSTNKRIKASGRHSNLFDPETSRKDLRHSRCNCRLNVFEGGHLATKNDPVTLRFQNDCEVTFDALDHDFRSKLSQYVTLCKSAKHSLLKNLRPDDIYEVSTTSIPCTDRFECR